MLLYAEDTDIFAETALDLQHSLNCLKKYSSLWKLNVNRSKTKIVIFGIEYMDKSMHYKGTSSSNS